MGLFDFFSRREPSNVQRNDDRIWLTDEAKLNWLNDEVLDRTGPPIDGLLLVAHFPDVLDWLEPLQAEAAVPCGVSLAADLSSELASRLPAGDESQLSIIVAEHHPLPARDDVIIKFAESLPCVCQLVFLVSMEEPLMQIVLGDHVKSLLVSLGMTQTEAIQARMVTRRLRKAQEKLARKVLGDGSAESSADWLANNLPGVTQLQASRSVCQTATRTTKLPLVVIPLEHPRSSSWTDARF